MAGSLLLNRDERFRVVVGDAIEVAASLDCESLDAVVMDPPYASGGFSESSRRNNTKGQGVRSDTKSSVAQTYFDGDSMGTSGIVWLLRELVFVLSAKMKEGSSLLVFCDWRQIANIAPAIESAGLRMTNIVVWDKGSSALGAGFRARHEMCLHYTKGTGRYFSKSFGNVLAHKRVPGAQKEHFAQKPVPLIRDLLQVVTDVDHVVFDPFCGSGSIGVAALLEGRRFIGADRAQGFADLATRRLENVCGNYGDDGQQIGLFSDSVKADDLDEQQESDDADPAYEANGDLP